jgi:hypothetical protein
VITDIVIVIAAALFIGVYVSWRAGRIDRLHARVDMAQAALDATLVRRSSVALELATSGLLDPATSLLLASAVHGTRGGDRPRDLAESDLTRALRAAFSQPDFRASIDGKEGADELLADVEAAAHQVFLARKFYNDVVAATRDARGRPLARVLRLSGRARAPEFYEMDDSLVAENTGAPLGLWLPGHTMVGKKSRLSK